MHTFLVKNLAFLSAGAVNIFSIFKGCVLFHHMTLLYIIHHHMVGSYPLSKVSSTVFLILVTQINNFQVFPIPNKSILS